MSSILISFFSLIFFPSQYWLLCLSPRCHDTMSKHFTLQGTINCANFSFTFVALTLANILCVRCRISHPVVSVFHTYCQHWKYILLLLQFKIFSAFTLQDIASSRLLPMMYWSNDFLNRVPRASIFKHCPEPQQSATHLSDTLTTQPLVCVCLQKKLVYDLSYNLKCFTTCNPFVACRIVDLR